MARKVGSERKINPAVQLFRSARSAFTLLELLIVLAIIVTIMSLGAPSVTLVLDKSKFRDGVLKLQAELGRTRLLAMKTGVPMIFRYQNDSGIYQIFPKSSTENSNQTEPLFQAPSAITSKRLPENALFFGGMTIESDDFQNLPQSNSNGTETRAQFVGSLHQETNSPTSPPLSAIPPAGSDPSLGLDFLSGNSKNNQSQWSDPILFYPNGRTSTAVIFLRSRPEKGKQNYYSEISFRGLTGAARVSSIATIPPGSAGFPSVLSEQAILRWRQRQRTKMASGRGE